MVDRAVSGPPGRPDHERNVNRLLVRPDLPAQAVLAPQEPVVAEVHDHGAPEQLPAPELTHEPADRSVEGAEGLELPSAHLVEVVRSAARGEGPDEARPPGLVRDVRLVERGRRRRRQPVDALAIARRRDRGKVGRDGREVQEERLSRVVHEVDRLGREHGRRVVGGAAPEVDQVAVLVERVAVVPLLRDAVDRDPPVPPGRHVVVAVQRVAVQVLADERGCVAGVVEPGRERRALVEARVPGRAEVRDDAGVVWVLAREDARPRGTALRRGRVVPVERHALAGEEPDVPHAPVRVEPLVVGDDHDDVEARRPARRRSSAARVAGDPERQGERRGDRRHQSAPPHVATR